VWTYIHEDDLPPVSHLTPLIPGNFRRQKPDFQICYVRTEIDLCSQVPSKRFFLPSVIFIQCGRKIFKLWASQIVLLIILMRNSEMQLIVIMGYTASKKDFVIFLDVGSIC
jgi:hypothetical protein